MTQLIAIAVVVVVACAVSFAAGPTTRPVGDFVLDFSTPLDQPLQVRLQEIDATLRERFGMTADDAAVGVLDVARGRVAMIHPDRIEYAASVPKIGILLAYFETHPQAATSLEPTTRHELGLMAKASNNEMASKFSHEIGLKKIQDVLDRYGFYDKSRGGGIWVGKHYGKDKERYGDPVADHSHAATVRQLLRWWLLLEQGKLVSSAACERMKEILASPDIPADDIKFVKGLAGRDVRVLRKWGTWKDWRHDTASVTGKDRHYILVALTHHARGDEYLEALAPAVDNLMLANR